MLFIIKSHPKVENLNIFTAPKGDNRRSKKKKIHSLF